MEMDWNKESLTSKVSPEFELTLDMKPVVKAIQDLNFVQLKGKILSFNVFFPKISNRTKFVMLSALFCFDRLEHQFLIWLPGSDTTGEVQLRCSILLFEYMIDVQEFGLEKDLYVIYVLDLQLECHRKLTVCQKKFIRNK